MKVVVVVVGSMIFKTVMKGTKQAGLTRGESIREKLYKTGVCTLELTSVGWGF